MKNDPVFYVSEFITALKKTSQPPFNLFNAFKNVFFFIFWNNFWYIFSSLRLLLSSYDMPANMLSIFT